MLKKIEGLPSNVLGVSAEGKVTRNDYENVLMPLLADAHTRGQHVRLLYELGPEFSSLTSGAVMDDFKVSLKYLRLFERCAIVTDVDWIRGAAQLMGSLIPYPVKLFKNSQLKEATDWLASPDAESKLKFELSDNGVLIIRPQGALRRDDFDKLAHIVDPWIETHQKMHGVVISVEKFPGWENIGAFIQHIEFVKSHHRKVRRVAVAMNGELPEIMSKAAAHFVEAKIKQFPFEKTNEAINWASQEG